MVNEVRKTNKETATTSETTKELKHIETQRKANPQKKTSDKSNNTTVRNKSEDTGKEKEI